MNNRSCIYLYIVLLASIFVSCGEDRTHEYEEVTMHNIWIYEQMQDNYLWADNLVEQKWNDYFAQPNTYLYKLTAKGDNDNWSYIDVDTLDVDNHQRGYFNHTSSYGFDYVSIQDPTGESTKTFARVVTVFDNSPASRVGLQRNDFIETIDGEKITTNNIDKLVKGKSRTLLVHRLYANEEEMTYSWVDSHTVHLEASEYVEDSPYPVTRVFNYTARYGYLMCNNLLEKENTNSRQPKDYKAQLDDVMAYFKSMNVEEFILDLRLCNYGTLEMANLLASYLISDADLGKTFAKTIWNEKNSSNNKTITYETSLTGKTLGLKRVHIITSGYTQGAAEWLINGLRNVLGEDNVILIGQTTTGQNAMTQHVGDYESILHLYPAVAYVADANDDYTSYSDGFKPSISVDEMKQAMLPDYGSYDEILLYYAIHALDPKSE